MQKPVMPNLISNAPLSATARAAVAMWLAQSPQAPAAASAPRSAARPQTIRS